MKMRAVLLALVIVGGLAWALPAMAADTEAALSYCQTDCWYGPDVSCSGSYCIASDEPGGYVECDGIRYSCDPPPPSVSCSEVSCQRIGDKSVWRIRATASGGCGSYSFQWYGANQISSPTANPNDASSVVLFNPLTAQAVVTSCGATASCTINLYPGCF